MGTAMRKDTRLVNIYLKIHHKKLLTMDDLAYLAEYDPECFAKTCKNVVYNIPEARSIMEVASAEPLRNEPTFEPPVEYHGGIDLVLERLKRLEMNHFPEINIDNEKVRNLLGNLYMELLFPHNDDDVFMNMIPEDVNRPRFDKKA